VIDVVRISGLRLQQLTEKHLPAGLWRRKISKGNKGCRVHFGLSTTVEGTGTALRLDQLTQRPSEVFQKWSLEVCGMRDVRQGHSSVDCLERLELGKYIHCRLYWIRNGPLNEKAAIQSDAFSAIKSWQNVSNSAYCSWLVAGC
jgi:hypothetical protein